jgi:outer membrane immunogenic protein
MRGRLLSGMLRCCRSTVRLPQTRIRANSRSVRSPAISAAYEYGLGFLPGLFWKTEYRFADYGTDRIDFLEGGAPEGDFLDNRKRVHTVRSELVW